MCTVFVSHVDLLLSCKCWGFLCLPNPVKLAAVWNREKHRSAILSSLILQFIQCWNLSYHGQESKCGVHFDANHIFFAFAFCNSWKRLVLMAKTPLLNFCPANYEVVRGLFVMRIIPCGVMYISGFKLENDSLIYCLLVDMQAKTVTNYKTPHAWCKNTATSERTNTSAASFDITCIAHSGHINQWRINRGNNTKIILYSSKRAISFSINNPVPAQDSLSSPNAIQLFKLASHHCLSETDVMNFVSLWLYSGIVCPERFRYFWQIRSCTRGRWATMAKSLVAYERPHVV